MLVNNAGTIQGERRESVDGIELTFATNVLGYHRVTSGLLDHFNTAGAPRIVVVASAFAGDLDLADLEFTRRPYDGLARLPAVEGVRPAVELGDGPAAARRAASR